jgi:hypothetical protein
MDERSRTNLSKFVARCKAHGKVISRSMLDEIVETNPKQRFAIGEDGLRIRANQSHSVDLQLGGCHTGPTSCFTAQPPPAWNRPLATSMNLCFRKYTAGPLSAV